MKIKPEYHGLIRREILDLVPDETGKLLDVGGGIGATAAWLKEQGKARCVGVIDIVEPHPQEDLADFRLTGNLERDPVLQTVTAEGPFDTILALDVLEHLVDPWAAVTKLHGLLAPNGVIVASIPNVRHLGTTLPLLLKGRWDMADEGILDRTHLRFFVKSTAVDLIESSGLKVEKVVDQLNGSRKISLIRKAGLGLLNDLTTFQYLIRARNVV